MGFGYIIYIIILVIYAAFVAVSANLYLSDWQYWIILVCIIGAYISGRYLS